MSFLAPLFLLGTLAIALPMIFHLIRRSTKDRLAFSSLLFISPTPPRLTRRSRLEQLLLLALRCAVICLLAFAFARPFLKSVAPAAPAGAGKRVLVLLDTSASMQRADLWAQASGKALALASRAGFEDSLAIVAFDRQSRTLLSFEEWAATAPGERPALVRSRLKDVAPGWFSTSLGQALVTAADSLSDGGTNTGAPAEIVVISDLQEGSKLEPVQGYDWPKVVQVSFQALKLPARSNASLQRVMPSEGETQARQPIRIRVTNSSDSRKEQFKLAWQHGTNPEPASPILDIYVPAGQSRVFSMPELGTNQPKPDKAVLTGDDDGFDNTLFVIHPEPKVVHVAYVANEVEDNPGQQLYFLKRAFQETYRQAVKLDLHKPDAPLASLKDAVDMIVTPGPLAGATALQLGELVRQGKILVYTLLTDKSAGDIAALLGAPEVSVSEASREKHSILATIDFQHPLFAPFSDPRFSDFSRIHFWKHRTVDVSSLAGARVLAKFDDGDPALIEVPTGKGRLYILTSGWQPTDSQLALSTKFVPLLYSLLEQTGISTAVESTYQVGDPLPSGTTGQGALVMRTPAGTLVPIAADGGTFQKTELPGVYVSESEQQRHAFAVNLDPVESRTVALAVDAFEALGAPVAGGQMAASIELRRQVKLKNADLERRQKIWRWVIVATLAVVLLETWLSARRGRERGRAREGGVEVKYGT